MKKLLTFTFLLLSSHIYAQKVEGWVVLNNGDTLFGQIRSHLTEYLDYDIAEFIDENGDKTKFKPVDLKCYMMSDFIYESRVIRTHELPKPGMFMDNINNPNQKVKILTMTTGKNDTRNVFLKTLINGSCTLYEYVYIIEHAGNELRSFFLMKEGEDTHYYDFKKLKIGKDLYFIDNIQLTYDLRNKKYKNRDVYEIVDRYNSERNVE